MALAGDLKEISFAELLQLCANIKRTGVLEIRHRGQADPIGRFHFQSGELFDGELAGARGPEAVFLALELREGTFEFGGQIPNSERRIHLSVGALLMEGMRREGGGPPSPDDVVSPPDHEADFAALREPDAEPAPGGRNGYRHDTPVSSMLSVDDGATQQHAILGFDVSDGPRPHPGEESPMRICPRCGKRYDSGETCPDDGAALTIADAHVTPTREVPQIAGPREPAQRSGGWAMLLVGGVIVLGAVAGVAAVSTGMFKPAAPPPPPPVVAPAPQPAPPPPPPAPVVQGVSDKEVLFGMAAPLSGPSRELGRQMKLGVEAAFGAINEAGGVNGRQLKLVVVDDGYEPTRTGEAMKTLWDKNKIFGVLGNVGTTAAVALPFALERKMLFFGAFTGAGLLRRDPPDRYVFNLRASYAEETAAVVKYLLQLRHLKPDQIAVFAQQDAYGDAGFSGVAKALRAQGVDTASIVRVGYARNTIDVTDAVAQVARYRKTLRAVVMVATYRAAAKFIEKMKETVDGLIYTNVSFVGSTALADELRLVNPKLAEGVIVTQVVPPVDSYATAILKYKAALARTAPGENPDYVSLEGYLEANLLAEALRRAGPSFDTEKLVDTLEGMKGYDLGVGTPVNFSATDHQALHRVWGTALDAQAKFQALELE